MNEHDVHAAGIRATSQTSAVDDSTAIRRSLVDAQAFGVLFQRHAPHIHRYLVLRLGRQVADDVLGDTFVAAFRRRHSYDLSRPDARPWLYGIATNLVGEHRRAEAREFRLQQAIVPDRDHYGHADQVAGTVTAQAARPALNRALADLADGDRHVLLLIAWGELTYEEVATVLEIPVGTVRSRLNRARTKVKEALGSASFTPILKERTSHG
jgi:RNA polymerase sigma factor (sigma-70 family)